MAGLQKTLDVTPTVASRGAPDAPSTTGAAVVNAAAGVASGIKSFVGEKKKAEFEEELIGLGQEVFAARTGKQLEGATKRFDRLKAAQEQGVLSDTYVQIETEKLLKEEIGKSPMFSSELRKYAADTLGFDPTGSQIRALYAAPRGGKDTFASKQLEQAQYMADNLGLNVQDVMKLQAKGMLQKQQADLVTSQAAIGAYGRQDILNSTMKEADSYITDVMGSVIEQVRAGGLSSPEQTVATVQSGIMAQKQALRDRYIQAGLNPSSADLAKDLAQIEEQWKPILELSNEGDLAGILERQASSITSAMTVEAMNVMGDIALLNKAGGQEAVKHYFLAVDKIGKKGSLELLQKTNPVLARTLNTLDDAKRYSAEAYKKVMGVAPSYADKQTLRTDDEQKTIDVLADQVAYSLIKDSTLDEEGKNRRLVYAKTHGQKFKMLGGYFQKGARQAASDEEVRFVTQTFEEEYPALIDRIVEDMNAAKGTVDEYEIRLEGQTLVKKFTGNAITSKAGKGSSSYWSGFQQPLSQPVTTGDLKRLQAFNDGLQNGWAEDLGARPLTFLGDTLTEINTLSESSFQSQVQLQEALDGWEQASTREDKMAAWDTVRSVDPEYAAEVERMVGYKGQSKGSATDE